MVERIDFKQLLGCDISNKVWVMPTDTIPGLSCSVYDKQALERIYNVKQRDQKKSFVVLVSSLEQVEELDVVLSPRQKELVLDKIWPGPVTCVFRTHNTYLLVCNTQTQTIACRLADNPNIQELCRVHGPLVSTSVNLSGAKHLLDIQEIEDMCREQIDYIVEEDWSEEGDPSVIIRFER